MSHRITDKWNQKTRWFRDATQHNDVAIVILHRLADDRIEDECRYLTRLTWHLRMSYQEVSYDELVTHVAPDKMKLLDHLFDAIANENYDAIDAWVAGCRSALPVIEDKWIESNRADDYVHELLSDGPLDSPGETK